MVLACRTTMPILHAAVETLGAGVHGLDDRPPSPSRQAEGTEAPVWHPIYVIPAELALAERLMTIKIVNI